VGIAAAGLCGPEHFAQVVVRLIGIDDAIVFL
jgi:hypothetical protein